jgi:hypothetical protein
MVKWSGTSENVLRQLQIVQILHTYVIRSQKIKKIELFDPTLLRNFPLKKSNFLGIFKNVFNMVLLYFCGMNMLKCKIQSLYAHNWYC